MGVFAVGFVALIFSYFTEKGTEIRFHAWSNSSGDAPGSLGVGNVGKDPTVDVNAWHRGVSPRPRGNSPRPDRPSRQVIPSCSPAWRPGAST